MLAVRSLLSHLVNSRGRGYARRGSNESPPWPRHRANDETPGGNQVSQSAAARAQGTMPAPGLRNIYACLVHESQECVIDLVRNLRCLDPDSSVLLYNGGSDPRLLEPASCFEKLGALIHPDSRRVDVRTLHEFALACMSYASRQLSFDTLTIVDSDH